MGPLLDLHNLCEDDRIDKIGHAVTVHLVEVAMLIDDEEDKIQRYIRKITNRYPGVQVRERVQGPVKGCVTIKFGPLQS